MAVTRIKNNQITDATITAAKLVAKTVTAARLEDNLTYGSNLTVSGNLTVNGATNTVSTTNTTIEDAVIVLNSDVTGTGGARDMGLYGERGDDTSVFMGYDESADLFVFAQTDSVGTATAINPTDYVGIRVGTIAADDTIVATGNVTGGNLITGAQVVATGNVTGGNVITAGLVVATGNVTGGNLNTGAQVVATANITGGNLITAGLVVATGNVTGGNLNTGAQVIATGNITGGNLITSAKLVGGSLEVGAVTIAGASILNMGSNKLTLVADPVGAQDAATKAYVDDLLSSVLTISDGSNTQAIGDGDTLTFAGTANEIAVTVSATDTLTISLPDDVTIGDTLTVTGNLVVQGTTTTVNSTVTQVADPIFQLGRGTDNAALESDDAKDRGLSLYYFEGSEKIAFMGFDTTANTFKYFSDATISSEVVSGTLGTAEFGKVVADNLSLDANTITSTNTNGNLELAANGTGKINVATGNELTIVDLDDTGLVFASTGELTTAAALTWDGTDLDASNFTTGGYVTATGNVTGGNLITGAQVVATGNVTGGNLNTGAQVIATGNVTGGNLNTGAQVVATGNVNGGNLVTGGKVSATGTVTGSSVLASDLTATRVTFAGASGLLADNANFTTTGSTVLIGGTSATTDAALKVNTTTSVMIAQGTNAERPAVGVVGMLRFSTTADTLEQYSLADGWETVGALSFTTIASQTFNGDDSTVAFTLSESQTTASCIVSINGVVQLPTTAYAVSTTTMTFTEAPATGDVVEVRKITTTTTVTNLDSGGGESTVTAQTSGEVDIKGNIMPVTNATYAIGNASVGWKTVHVTGNVTGGNLITAGLVSAISFAKTGVDGTGNIGQTDNAFDTVHATATSAQYADLAEKYEADAEIEPGTVVHFGGEKEVSTCDIDHCTKVAGVVSTDPAYRMNERLDAEHTVFVALTGRVPCKVTGSVQKGDMMVSAGNGMARAEASPTYGAVIGKALENWEGGEGVIEVVIK